VSRFADDSKERVRQAADVLQVVGARVDLQRKGVDSYFGNCPFHDERTPSFHVRPSTDTYYCFGCGQKGDVFSFLMETEGMSFPEALESLADRFGVELERVEEDPDAARRRDRERRLLALLDRAATWYGRYLWDSAEATAAREYLAGRGLSEETLKIFRVGYAPSAWDRVLTGSLQAGYTEEEIVAAGLAQQARGGTGRVFDRFRGRIVFPLADERGRVRGFGARAMGNDDGPKYLNSSENEVFHKGRQLFALDLARRAAAASGSVVLAEGYTDVLALHQAGVGNAAGLMGTALTEDHVGLLARVAPVLVLALDADGAGQGAMLKAAEVARSRKLELRVVALPEGSDPADLLASEGAEALRSRADRSVPFVVFRVERILAEADVGSAEGRDRALEELRPVIRPLAPSVQREELIQRIASHLELSPGLAASLTGGNGRVSAGDSARPGAAAPPPSARDRTERTFLGLCLASPLEGAAALARLDFGEHFTSELMRRAAEHLAAHAEDPLGTVPENEPELGAFLTRLAATFTPENARPQELEHAGLILERNRLDRAIATGRAARSLDLPALAKARKDVNARLAELAGRS
jgi:DNA primase